ncbi:MAG: ankyrin repeat domain-containing protein [Aliidongia sp.]
MRQAGWAGWLHHRQDATLDALFAWSERDLPSKRIYRKLVALMLPAQAELVQAFRQVQGLTPGEAQQAAELVLLELVEHTIGTYPGSAAIEAARPASLQAYHQRFATAPAPGDLEAGRPIRSLHSAVLNRLPEDAVEDYVKYEFLMPGHTHSTGAGETSLMAAVEAPDMVSLLLQAGADPNEPNQWRKTSLMAAAQADRPETARRLLDARADVAATTIPWTADEGGVAMFQIHTGGRTALMYAAGNAHPTLIRCCSTTAQGHGPRHSRADGLRLSARQCGAGRKRSQGGGGHAVPLSRRR